jgi:hypothetical protein
MVSASVFVRTICRNLAFGGIRPQAAHLELARTGRHLGRLALLLIDVRLDHLSRQSRRQFAVLATFEQHAHDDVRIAPRSESDEPAILRDVSIVLVLRTMRDRTNLRRSRLAGRVDARYMR